MVACNLCLLNPGKLNRETMPLTLKARRVVVASVAAMCTSAVAAGLGAPAYSTTPGPTVLPELNQALVLGTTTAAQATDSRPAGTRVSYQFDEPLDTSVTPDPADFLLYDEDGTAVHADQVSVSSDEVMALFESLDTPASASSETLATTSVAAVADAEGNASPIGAVRVTRYEKVTGLDGCPVLERVDNFRVKANRTKVDFVFRCLMDEVEAVTATAFHLDLLNGQVRTGLKARADVLSATVTVSFPGNVGPRRVARGTVDSGGVRLFVGPSGGDNNFGGEDQGNVIDSAPVSHRGFTSGPDLVRVELRPSRKADQPSHAIFVFDQRVRRPLSHKFILDRHLRLYRSPRNPYGRDAVRFKGHPRWVRVSFWSVDQVLAAGVLDDAVRGARASGVDVTNAFSFTRSTTGLTSGPDLRFLTFDPTASTLTATLTFDEPLVGEPKPSAFHLYRKDGQEWDAQSCALMPSEYGESPVSCTFPISAPAAPNTTEFLATVDSGAVQDADGRANPEGTASGYYATCATDPYQPQCS